LKKAQAFGLKCNMELASVGAAAIARIVTPCLPYLDILIVNDVEIGALSGLETSRRGKTDIEACKKAAQIVFDRGVKDLVVVHSPVVALALGKDQPLVIRYSTTIPTSEIASTNGAGDAFAAGMMYAVHEDWSVERALELAHASAACSLRSLATTGSVERWSICLELADRWGWRTEEAGG
jgi:sugar/nucleoside kinase (ribokinase family)